jgi:hypothetical protein
MSHQADVFIFLSRRFFRARPSLRVPRIFSRRLQLFSKKRVVFHHARAPLKLVHGQAGERRACAAGRQRVTWPGHVIAQNRRRKCAEKNRARRQNFFGNLARIARHHFAMLRRKLVRQSNRVVERLYLNQPAVVLQRALWISRRASLGNCFAISISTAFKIFAEVVTSQTRSWPEPCSACASKSAAANFGFAVSSASTSTSLGPGSRSIATWPTSNRLAVTT